ncbi:TPA: hypothetical protein ACH3X1_015926 [Trebouxia sp. C0004]
MSHTVLPSQHLQNLNPTQRCLHIPFRRCTAKLHCSSSLHAHLEIHAPRLFQDQPQVLHNRQHSRKRKSPVQCQAGTQSDYRTRSKQDVRIVVAGSTGYIGKYVTKELIKRGYNVVAFAREKSGVGGKQSTEQTQKDFKGADVRFGDVSSKDSLRNSAFSEPADVVVSCLASRTGGKKDSWAIDYQATLNTLEVAQETGAKHFVLLSAICVQKPLLEFQHAKLKFEQALQSAQGITYSIVRPTAFFKSLAGQVENVKKGFPYIMFGDGHLASCKPISEADLASFMADCVEDQDKVNQVLPIGGPGRAWSAKEQGQYLFKLAGKKERFISAPVGLMDGIITLFDGLTRFFPGLEDSAEFGRIGRYYATESMLAWDDKQQKYVADATPSYGKESLEQFFERVMKEGLAGQELGDAAIF